MESVSKEIKKITLLKEFLSWRHGTVCIPIENMKCIKYPGQFFLKPTDAVFSRNSCSINGTGISCVVHFSSFFSEQLFFLKLACLLHQRKLTLIFSKFVISRLPNTTQNSLGHQKYDIAHKQGQRERQQRGIDLGNLLKGIDNKQQNCQKIQRISIFLYIHQLLG